MKELLLILAVAVMCSSVARADDFEDAMELMKEVFILLF